MTVDVITWMKKKNKHGNSSDNKKDLTQNLISNSNIGIGL